MTAMPDRVWLLFRREPDDMILPDSPIHLWVRRVDVFTTKERAISHLVAMIGPARSANLAWNPHPLFPELLVGDDANGHYWLIEKVPVDPKGAG